MYLLDTNICTYLIKRKPLSLWDRFRALSVGQISVSTITVAELQYGIEKSQFVQRNQQALDEFLLSLMISPFEQDAAIHYGRLRVRLEKSGLPIGAHDMLIAAHALSLGAVLVTNNDHEFARIEGLHLENWVES
ncbi:MAG: type II toxin-antitoxin system VapC family toxin [Caldilineaceae bacterium]|nr:type II toxin-antitoxin system VapC family toxin [Caldilineaceae bacterium]